MNHSLLITVFPSAWKEFDLVPILKDGDHEIPNNNRPVSLLPALCQICERAALNQRTEYMIRGNCLTEHQNGNKKQHSTETLNIFKTDLTYEAMDRKQVTALVLFNFFKGVRQYRTWTPGGEFSVSRIVAHGVPQGSILGPGLFNIYSQWVLTEELC